MTALLPQNLFVMTQINNICQLKSNLTIILAINYQISYFCADLNQ